MTLPIVVADASVALKWFHEQGEEEVEAARDILVAYVERRIDLVVLDLTTYELGNALTRGVGAAPTAVATVLEALVQISTPVTMTPPERSDAASIASEHGLTFYDAAYAAVARERGGRLATMDRDLLRAGLGHRPGDVMEGG